MVTDEEWLKHREIRVPLPLDPEVEAVFNAWKQRYEAARDEGYEKGWLSPGYEPDEILEPLPPGYETRLETDEERQRRLDNPWARFAAEQLERAARVFAEQSVALNRVVVSAVEPGSTESGFVTFPVLQARPRNEEVADHFQSADLARKKSWNRGRLTEDDSD